MFPRYLFVAVSGPWRSLSSTTGIAFVLLNGNKPALVNDAVITGIKKQCDESGFFIGFRRGQTVRIERGPMVGQIGIYDGMRGRDRCDVLLKLLGSQVRASVLEGDLAAA